MKGIAFRISAVTPGVLAVLMYVVTPTYFRPVFGSIVGWLLVSISAATTCLAYGLVEVAIWLFRKGRVVLGVLVVVGYSITWLVAVLLVLLGPAILIQMKPRS